MTEQGRRSALIGRDVASSLTLDRNVAIISVFDFCPSVSAVTLSHFGPFELRVLRSKDLWEIIPVWSEPTTPGKFDVLTLSRQVIAGGLNHVTER